MESGAARKTSTVKAAKFTFLPFGKALLYARSLKLKTCREWAAWCKTSARPANIPSDPSKLYTQDGWQGFGHWLGTGNGKCNSKQFLPFDKALLHARSLKLKTQKEWTAWCKSDARPANIPSTPKQVYKHEGWQGCEHWLGVAKRYQFMPFEKALLYARSLKLKGAKEWKAWSKIGARPVNIPSAPQCIYRHDGWQGWGHWLGTSAVATKNYTCVPFQPALLYARSLKLKSKTEWATWCKAGARPSTMPSNPQKKYKHGGWQNWGHWLGTDSVTGGQLQLFLPFKQALLYTRALNLKSQVEWRAWLKTSARPANIPTAPHRTYTHDGWQGYGHWLGTGNVGLAKDHKFLPFKNALLYARSLQLKGETEWNAWSKSGARPPSIPAGPRAVYLHAGWQSMGHWLGTNS